MIYANKKVNQKVNVAQQMAQIIATVNALEEKKLIILDTDTVFLDPSIWKDKVMAINWINCLQLYYVAKRRSKKADHLYFKDLSTHALIGSFVNKKAKVLLFS